MGADIYLYDKRREDLDARISAWINEPKHQGIMSRLGLSPDEERSMVHIWRGGIDKESKALAKEFEALQETHYFRDSYNASSLFWVLGLSWWQLARNDVIDDDDVMSAIDVQLLLQHYYEVRGDRLSDDAIEKWYAGEMEKGMISDKQTWQEWAEYFREKGEHFEQFCKRTLENDGYWKCSV